MLHEALCSYFWLEIKRFDTLNKGFSINKYDKLPAIIDTIIHNAKTSQGDSVDVIPNAPIMTTSAPMANECAK